MQVQLLDLPGIIEGAKDGKGRGKQVTRTCFFDEFPESTSRFLYAVADFTILCITLSDSDRQSAYVLNAFIVMDFAWIRRARSTGR